MRVIELLGWQPYCWTTETCCLTRNRIKYVMTGLFVVLCHFEKLCFNHRFQVDDTSVQSEHSFPSTFNHSCPEQYIRYCVQVVLLFSRDVCSTLSACSTSHRISKIPDDRCLFLCMQYNLRVCARCHRPLVTLPPSSKSSTRRISQ